MKALSLFLFFIVFAAEIDLGEIKNGFASNKKDPRILKISVVDSEESAHLFNKFSGDKSIPFRFPLDGCYARATEMVRIAEKEKVIMGKIYISGRLIVKTDSAKYPLIIWGWHVAPLVFVKQQDESINLMVFDPSIFKKPVTIKEWKKKMMGQVDGLRPRIDEVYYGSRYQYFPSSYEENKTKWAKKDLDNAKTTSEKYRALQDMGAPVDNSNVQYENFNQQDSTKEKQSYQGWQRQQRQGQQ